MKRILTVIACIFFFMSCVQSQENFKANKIKITTIDRARSIDFIRIDSIPNFGKVLSYSYSFASSGGCKIVGIENVSGTTIFDDSSSIITCMEINSNSLFYVITRLENKVLKSYLLNYHFSQKKTDTMITPLSSNIRRVVAKGNQLFIDGIVDGVVKIFGSNLDGKWKEYPYSGMGYKDAYILTPNIENTSLVSLSKSYNEDNRVLIGLSTDKMFKEIYFGNIPDELFYIVPVSNNSNLICLFNNESIKVIDCSGRDLQTKYLVPIPKYEDIKNVIITNKFLIAGIQDSELNFKIFFYDLDTHKWDEQYLSGEQIIFNKLNHFYVLDEIGNINEILLE